MSETRRLERLRRDENTCDDASYCLYAISLLEEAEAEIDALRAERDALKEEVATITQDLANVERQARRVYDSEAENAALRAERDDLRRERDFHKRSVLAVEAERDRLVKALEANGRIDSPLVAEQLDMLRAERDHAKGANALLATHIRNQQAELVALVNERNALRQQMDHALDLLSEVTTTHRTPDNAEYNECERSPCEFCVQVATLKARPR